MRQTGRERNVRVEVTKPDVPGLRLAVTWEASPFSSPRMNLQLPTPSLRALRGVAACLLSAVALLPAPVSAAGLTTLRTLNSAVEGVVTFAPLTQGADGLYYGATREGGSNNAGAVFRIGDDGGSFSLLTSFPGPDSGVNPEGGLVQARDGFFYGTTYSGGVNGYGTLYQLTPTGALTILGDFSSGNPGGNPAGRLLLGLDGYLYGTASFGGSQNYGTLFRSTVPNGATAVLVTFSGGMDGAYPESDLIQATDGNFYGTTIRGGASDFGTIFRVTPGGARTILYSFTGNLDGAEPLRGVVQARDGNFYGIARTGGAGGGGVIYRLTPGAVFTVLYSFTPSGANPYNSYGGLALGSDGNLYGVTFQGGASGVGTIFRSTLNGAVTVLYSFTGGGDGAYPRAGLTLGSDGAFYGTASGFNGNFSTIFRFDLGLPAPTPVITALRPGAAAVGDTIALLGDHFIDADSVTFTGAGGVAIPAASFTVRSRTYLEAVAPAGAVTGAITVKTHGKSGASPVAITITEVVTTPPVVLPTVTLNLKDSVASEAGKNKGKFKVTRTGDLSQELVVLFKASKKSTATRGTDYDLAVLGVKLPSIVNSVTIPAGAASVGVAVAVIDDDAPEIDETVVVQLKPGANYTLGNPRKRTVTIADDD